MVFRALHLNGKSCNVFLEMHHYKVPGIRGIISKNCISKH
jgi:hypothetical protein